jgi:nicotinamidase-related amidase
LIEQASEVVIMPLTAVDAVPALVVIDLQKGIAGLPTVHPFAGIVERTARLAHVFRERNFPVVLVNVDAMAPGRTDRPRPTFTFPPDWAEIVPELHQEPSDHVVTKQRVGAFLGTSLDDYLRKRHATQIVLAGVSTSAGVESTARSAYDLGYNVVFAIDAMTDLDADAHRFCLEKVFPRFGETETTDRILAMLATA